VKKLLLALGCLSGCYMSQYPATPEKYDAFTYEAYAGGAQGTAWVIDSHHLVTAGHMCERSSDIVVTRGFIRVPGKATYWEFSPKTPDLCVVSVEVDLGKSMVISATDPEEGAMVCYVGFPDGVHAQECGKFEGPNVVEAKVDHGASGSALITGHGVVGMVVQLNNDGENLLPGLIMTTRTQLLSGLDSAGVDYTMEPNAADPDLEQIIP
jgi:hypothetical protein